MRRSVDRLGNSARFLGRSFALPCAALLLLTSSTEAGTVLQFAQVNASDDVTATQSGGVTTLSTANNVDGALVSIPVVVSNFNGAPFPPAPVFETFVGVTSTGTATSAGGTISQLFSGVIMFTSGTGGTGTDFLTATFTNAVFSGSANAASLNVSAPNLTFASDLATFGAVTGMSLSFSGITPALGITGNSVASFTAQNSGTFSATNVPEPGTLCLASVALVCGTLAFGRKKMQNQG
jgi:hypothetical protein